MPHTRIDSPTTSPPSAMEGEAVPTLYNSLIGVKPFAYSGYISIFHPQTVGVKIQHQNDVHTKYLAPPIIKGVRNKALLWQVPLINNTTHDGGLPNTTRRKQAYMAYDTPTAQANNVYELPSIPQGIKWMYAVCGYPVKSTWLKAIHAGNYIGWPLLSIEIFYKHYPEIEETPKVHLNQVRQNLSSTKPTATPPPTTDDTTLRGKRSHEVYYKVYEAN